MLEGRYFRPGVALACAAALAFPSPSLARNQNPASPLVPPSLYQALADFFPVGAAVWKGDLSGEHAELLKKHFISITPENYMKWQYLRPSEGVYDFSQADALASAILVDDLAQYQAEHRHIMLKPRLMAQLLLHLARHPLIRRRTLRAFSAEPDLFSRLLGLHVGDVAARQMASVGLHFGWRFVTA